MGAAAVAAIAVCCSTLSACGAVAPSAYSIGGPKTNVAGGSVTIGAAARICSMSGIVGDVCVIRCASIHGGSLEGIAIRSAGSSTCWDNPCNTCSGSCYAGIWDTPSNTLGRGCARICRCLLRICAGCSIACSRGGSISRSSAGVAQVFFASPACTPSGCLDWGSNGTTCFWDNATSDRTDACADTYNVLCTIRGIYRTFPNSVITYALHWNNCGSGDPIASN